MRTNQEEMDLSRRRKELYFLDLFRGGKGMFRLVFILWQKSRILKYLLSYLMWWLILCINLTGLRDPQRAGNIISGCVCEGIFRRD